MSRCLLRVLELFCFVRLNPKFAGLFQVLFSFHLKGHTHGDADAAFGTASNHLRKSDALTLEGKFSANCVN